LARKILLADDSVTAQNMGRKILADAGYEVITVNNGSAALKKIAEHKPDLIVLDVYMPGYSGLEVCQRLKEAQETSRVPVLLTVGKLEPFKPEEAKRVRADGFIVKPFEASELLSALSKLEDKIVPRAEASKPGRFARATAAIEEGRYDKTVAMDEDTGWKNRIAFPPKKKEPSAQEDGDDPAIYNALNKDLRTRVEPKPADHRREAKPEDGRVDLGALAPEGLPKDVTPEEIAALAAAAAQVKGKVAEAGYAEPAPIEVKTEQKVEASEPTQAVPQLPQEVKTVLAPGATFAEQKSEEQAEQKIEALAEQSSKPPAEVDNIAAPSSADVMAAITALESARANSWLHGGPGRTADEPVTMAAAAGAGSVGAASRWTAVAVAVAPEEGALSLEQEMQKAYAACAAAESGHAGFASASTETQPVSAEPAAPVEASLQAEAAQTTDAAASAATEAIRAAVKDLEVDAASFVTEAIPAPTEPEISSVEMAETAEQLSPAAPQPDASVEDKPEVTFTGSTAETPALEAAAPDTLEVRHEETNGDAPVPEATAEVVAETPETVSVPVNEARVEEAAADDAVNTAALAASEPSARSTRGRAAGESEVVETTAAAWASWHRIRESGDSNFASTEPARKEVEDLGSDLPDGAARAVAAGAEKSPEEASASEESDAQGIASIVDSVLADLRPKIFEEISRKMGKRK
jgi:two-component system chemotaxis response regulator CheY